MRVVLLLFDIDGTLLGGAADTHQDAMWHALRVVHGVDAESVISPFEAAGRTDGEIARVILLDAGISAARIDELADAVRDQRCDAYADMCPADLSDKVLPGVRELLVELSGRAEVKLSLLSGNFEPIARMKLHRAGIGGCFERGQGAFGSDAEDRAALPHLARRRAGSLGAPYARERTLVIGDTPRDIACARADGVRCIAVSTGPYAADELVGADAVVSDAGELRGVLEGLM